MGLFYKRDTTIITDLANWPGIEANNGEATTVAHTECLGDCMPAEWHPQRAVQITWPDENTDWQPRLDEAVKCYLRIAYEIATTQPLIITCSHADSLNALLREKLPQKAIDNIIVSQCEINDTWVRDYGFITVVENGKYKLCDFRFNGWGDKFCAESDNAVNRHLFQSNLMTGSYHDCLDFVFEGGSIESDGRGTLLTTSHCLLNPNRNPSLSKGDITHRLLRELKSQRILWLDHGYLSGDDTDSHIDTLARLCPNDTIAYVKCSDPHDEHYKELSLMEQQLKSFQTTSDRPYRLVALPMGPKLYDEEGLRLPTTYANYLIINHKRILMPTYGDPETDQAAAKALEKAFPGYSVTGIDCRILVWQHGSLHCSTMQYY